MANTPTSQEIQPAEPLDLAEVPRAEIPATKQQLVGALIAMAEANPLFESERIDEIGFAIGETERIDDRLNPGIVELAEYSYIARRIRRLGKETFLAFEFTLSCRLDNVVLPDHVAANYFRKPTVEYVQPGDDADDEGEATNNGSVTVVYRDKTADDEEDETENESDANDLPEQDGEDGGLALLDRDETTNDEDGEDEEETDEADKFSHEAQIKFQIDTDDWQLTMQEIYSHLDEDGDAISQAGNRVEFAAAKAAAAEEDEEALPSFPFLNRIASQPLENVKDEEAAVFWQFQEVVGLETDETAAEIQATAIAYGVLARIKRALLLQAGIKVDKVSLVDILKADDEAV